MLSVASSPAQKPQPDEICTPAQFLTLKSRIINTNLCKKKMTNGLPGATLRRQLLAGCAPSRDVATAYTQLGYYLISYYHSYLCK